jgi:ABC-type glycerol-3-phosphate transport system substrate-binding protein
VWVTEHVAPLPDGAETQILEQQIATFEATHPGLVIELRHKKAEGLGGIENFLATASAVAPAVMPDLVALDTQILPGVAQKNLIVPLDELLSPELLSDLYPFAREACMVNDRLMCVQFEAEGVEHAIYNPSKIAVAPLTWTEVFSSGATYIFPAAGQNGQVNRAFLIQYLSTGATLVDESGNPTLDVESLTQVLSFYQQGIERGAIPTDVLAYQTVENCWPKYLQAEVVMSDISSDLYLSVGSGAGQPTDVPTRDGQEISLSQGYAWALVARDPNRQELAVRLLQWLMNPANMAAWSRAAASLPTRRAAFEQMPHDPYVTFMYSQLERTVPYRTTETHARIYRAMQQAIDAVLRQGISPEDAARNVLLAAGQEAPL